MPASIFAYEDSYDLFVYQPAIIDQNINFFLVYVLSEHLQPSFS